MNFWKMSKLQATRALVTTIGVSLIALLATVMYWQTTQAAPIDGGNGQAHGLITKMPANGFIGEWVIDTNAVVADQATEIRQAALLHVGGCAQVNFQVQGATKRALSIEGAECQAHPTATLPGTIPPTATVTPGDDHGGDDHGGDNHGGDDDKIIGNAPHGRITSLPDNRGLLGNWVISGTTYVVTKTTQLEQRFGRFKVGACVQVKSDSSTNPPTALRVRTMPNFVCASDDDHGDDGHGGNPGFPPGLAHGTLFGMIQSFPTTTLTGTWQIGGMSLVADNKTKFNQERGAFAISVTVQVDFYIDTTGVNHAVLIATKFANGHPGHGDDGGGDHEGEEGKAFGTLDSFPSGLLGTWVIGGIEYTTTNKTKIEPKQGAFNLGVLIKVEYFLDANNHRIAREIETTTNNGGSTDKRHPVLVGFVESMPISTSGFIGIWQISDITFTTNLSTTFDEEHGTLAVGSFVKVEYSVTNGSRVIVEIETHVPPGAGDHNHMGKIEDRGSDDLAAASVSANSTWKIAGKSYSVTPATVLDESLGALTVDQTALVNSYTAADGTEVATQIRGITVNDQVFLPLLSR